MNTLFYFSCVILIFVIDSRKTRGTSHEFWDKNVIHDALLKHARTRNTEQSERYQLRSRDRKTHNFYSNKEAMKLTGCNITVQNVPLLKNSTHLEYLPKCVKLKRCTGCCPSSVQECVPIDAQNVTVEVQCIDMVESNGKKSNRVKFRYINVTLEEHLACGCFCRAALKNCNKNQEFNAKSCQCQCSRNSNSKRSCKEPRIWDKKKCECTCNAKERHQCEGKGYYNSDKCRCEPNQNWIEQR